MNYWIEISKKKKYPTNDINNLTKKFTRAEEAACREIITGTYTGPLNILPRLAFERQHLSTYRVQVNSAVVELMFNKGIYPDLNQVFELDRDLFQLVWSDLLLTFTFKLLNTLFPRQITKIIWSYICNGAYNLTLSSTFNNNCLLDIDIDSIDTNDIKKQVKKRGRKKTIGNKKSTVKDDTNDKVKDNDIKNDSSNSFINEVIDDRHSTYCEMRHHFMRNGVLNCCGHVSSLDYLNNYYDVVDSSLDHSLLPKPGQLLNLSCQVTKLEDQLKQLESQVKRLNDKKRRINELYEAEAKELEEKNKILKRAIDKKINNELDVKLLAKEYYRLQQSTENKLKDEDLKYSKITQWIYQACDHGVKKDCDQACYRYCIDSYSYLLFEADKQFREELKSGLTIKFTRGFTVQGVIYEVVWNAARDYQIQINVATQKQRRLRSIDYLLYDNSSLTRAEEKDLEILFNVVGSPEDYTQFKQCARHYEERIKKLFLDSQNSTGQSLRKYLSEQGLKISFDLLGFNYNPELAEAFLLRRRNSLNKFCLLGFHGTRDTPAQTILKSGLDPRFSNPMSFLGSGAYISTSAHYCHVNQYCKALTTTTTKDGIETSYQMLVVCFLPGVTYYECNPNMAPANTRRVAPTGFTTVSCTTFDNLIYALYDRNDAYPLCVVNYKIIQPSVQ